MPSFKALRLHAGPTARRHLEQNGLQPQDIGVVPGAAGGPKGLILGPLDRFVFGQWLPQSAQPVHLVGAKALTLRYAAALAAFGIPSVTLEEDAAARGLFQIGAAIEAA